MSNAAGRLLLGLCVVCTAYLRMNLHAFCIYVRNGFVNMRMVCVDISCQGNQRSSAQPQQHHHHLRAPKRRRTDDYADEQIHAHSRNLAFSNAHRHSGEDVYKISFDLITRIFIDLCMYITSSQYTILAMIIETHDYDYNNSTTNLIL